MIRADHMITQYIWALENDSAFDKTAKGFVSNSLFNSFRVLVQTTIRPVRKMVGDDHSGGIRPGEWAFLYLEMWIRLGGFNSLKNELFHDPDVMFFKTRLGRAGHRITRHGVVADDTPESQNPCAEIILGQPQPCVLAPEPEKEEPMYNTVEIKTITYINNADVTKLTDEQLIDAIKTIENEIAALKAVKTKSTKITAKITEAQDTLAKVVAVLDGR